MAISTKRKRESALLDENPAILPDGDVGYSDRYTLLGQYSGITNQGAQSTLLLNLYIEQARATTFRIDRARRHNFYIDRARSVGWHIERARAINSYVKRAKNITFQMGAS